MSAVQATSAMSAVARLMVGFEKAAGLYVRARADYDEAKERENLKRALEAAVVIEFTTIPLYLTALWSIRDQDHEFAVSLRYIVQEEMLHMSLACNLLSAIGGTPGINTAVPTYPDAFPLDVHPELHPPLSKFSPEALVTFMEIERSVHTTAQVPLGPEVKTARGRSTKSDVTIGELYGAILDSFRRLHPALSVTHQMSGPLAWMVVKNMTDVEDAIGIIRHQGEGYSGTVGETRGGPPAHYFRFKEMSQQKKLVQKADGTVAYGQPIAFDFDKGVRPMAVVPTGGYVDTRLPSDEVRQLLRRFNLRFSSVLDHLQKAWTCPGGQSELIRAIDTMFELEAYATQLMDHGLANSRQTYGPDFRYIPSAER
jgi:hypothetical protein